MRTVVTIETSRTDYSAKAAAERSLTVGELIEMLSEYDENTKVVFSNDNGYTYGRISFGICDEVDLEEDCDEQEG
jgi:hypothetical protein